MTPLGLHSEDCRGALGHYRRRLVGLRALIERSGRGEALPELRVALEDFATNLEVDVRSRSGGSARERMTRVESAVFTPALRRLWEFYGRLAPDTPPGQWLGSFERMDLELAAAEAALSAWERRHPGSDH